MPKRETIREQIAVIHNENKHQTQAIEDLTVVMKEHIKSSNCFRERVEHHAADISWLKKSTWGVISILTGITVWVVATFILK
jgi:hypothetical protein